MKAADPKSPLGRGATATILPSPAPDSGAAAGGLDRRQVVGGAISLLDRDGLHGLTMRRLGSYLGVESMALYRYVPGREGLLEAVVETVVDELYGDPDVVLSSSNWPDYVRRLAHGIRGIALAHPQVFHLVATRPPAAPWVRPPLRSLRWMESFLQTLRDSKFSNLAAVSAYQSFSSFLLGHLLLEVASHGLDLGPDEDPDLTSARRTDLGGYPMLQELRTLMSEDRSAEVFDSSLEVLISHLGTLRKH